MDRKRPPDPLKERISSLGDMPAGQAIPHKPAPPPTSPPRLGFGKLVVPAKKPQPLPLAVKSSPEATRVDGMLQPAPGSHAPPSRSMSPPPAELAPDPQSARQARQDARKAVVEQERRESVRPAPAPVLDSIKIELPANLRGGIGALGKAILGAIAAALVGGGGAMVGSQTASQLPPAVAECPAQVEQLRGELRQLRDRVGSAERDVDEGRAERRRTDRKVEDTIGEVERLKKAVPRIEGVKVNQ